VAQDTSACQQQIAGGGAGEGGRLTTFDLGGYDAAAANQTQAQWSLIDAKNPAKGVQLNMTGATQCWPAAGGPRQAFTSTVQMLCSRTARPLVVVEPSKASPCAYTFLVKTPLACPVL